MRIYISSASVICVDELDGRVFSAYLPAMSLELSARIRLLRTKLKKNQTEFGEMLGVTQGTVSRWESGASPEPEHLSALADLDNVSLDEFLGRKALRGQEGPPLPIVGYVGAGAAIFALDDHAMGGGLGDVERPPFVQGKAIAVEVRGDSLVPIAYDGWRLVYAGEQTLVEEEVLNRLCIVALLDGRMLVKRLLRGTKPQRYHLLSSNAPLMEDQEVLWAARVKAIIPD